MIDVKERFKNRPSPETGITTSTKKGVAQKVINKLKIINDNEASTCESQEKCCGKELKLTGYIKPDLTESEKTLQYASEKAKGIKYIQLPANCTIGDAIVRYELNQKQQMIFRLVATAFLKRVQPTVEDLHAHPGKVHLLLEEKDHFDLIMHASGGCGKTHVAKALRAFCEAWDPDTQRLIMSSEYASCASLLGAVTNAKLAGQGFNNDKNTPKYSCKTEFFRNKYGYLLDEFSLTGTSMYKALNETAKHTNLEHKDAKALFPCLFCVFTGDMGQFATS